MTTAITKESLAARIAELESGARSLKEDYTLAAYKMLLATMEAEPVHSKPDIADAIYEAFIVVCECHPDGVSILRNARKYTDKIRHAQPAQPAPVVPDELLKEYLRLVDCMLSDYRNSNYGDAQRWIGHIVEASDAFEEKHGESPWEMARKNCRAAMLSAAPQSPGSEPATVPDIDYSALMYENREPCAICGKVSSHPEGWHYCHGKK